MGVPEFDTQDYEAFVRRTGQPNNDLVYCAMALNEEAGEVAGWVKKVVLRKRPGKLIEQDLLEELGDVLWNLTRLGEGMGWTLHDIMKANVEKLTLRREKEGVASVG